MQKEKIWHGVLSEDCTVKQLLFMSADITVTTEFLSTQWAPFQNPSYQ